MKARVATMLSLTGVLVAGSAAALVNTQVLRSAAPASNTVQVLGKGASSTSSAAAEPTEPSATTIEVTTSATTKAELTAYQVESSGIVTLDQVGDVLRIESATPADGWQVTALRQVDALNVLVTFQQNDTVVEFRANLLYGKVSPSVTTYPASTGPGTSTATDPSTGGSNTSTPGTTRTTVDDDDDDDSKAPTTSDDSGKGRGGGGDDPSDDD
jgi:hypothetical protein